MQNLIIELVFLVLIILALVMIANKLRLAYPIVLVLGGLALSFIVRFSKFTIDPDLIFYIFLPPLLYEAAWQVSWKEFWRWRRVILSFAFPIVVITSCVIAFVSYSLIPGFTLALGFLLGGIISPPDAISSITIMRQVKAPKSLVRVAEGESLLNDASSLIVFRFAVAAVITGQFHFHQAAISFVLVVLMGTIDRTSRWIDFLWFSSLVAYYTKHRNCFNSDNTLLYVLFCRALSFFRCSGSSKRRTFFIREATEYANISEQAPGIKCMDCFRFCT